MTDYWTARCSFISETQRSVTADCAELYYYSVMALADWPPLFLRKYQYKEQLVTALVAAPVMFAVYCAIKHYEGSKGKEVRIQSSLASFFFFLFLFSWSQIIYEVRRED